MILSLIKREYLLRKAHTLSMNENHDESLKVLDRISSECTLYPGTALQKAIVLMKKRDLVEAEKQALAAVSRQPDNPANHIYLGVIRYDLKHYPGALASFDKVLALSPKNNLARCYHHLSCLALHQYTAESLNEFKTILRHGNSGVQGRCIVLCESFFKDKSHDPAFRESVFKEQMPLMGFIEQIGKSSTFKLSLAVRRLWVQVSCLFSPEKKKAYLLNIQGDLHCFNKEFDDALKAFSQALTLLPSLEEAGLKRIAVYHQQNDVKAILNLYETNPEHSVLFKLANGKVTYDKLTDSDKDSLDLDAAFDLASVYFRLNEYGKALALAAIIPGGGLDFFPDYFMGLCHMALGNPDTALHHFLLSLRNPNPDIAVLTLEELIRHETSL